MLTLQDVTLRLGGRRVLDQVTLKCSAGQVTALIGPNGAGKTTLLRVIAGDEAPDTGSISLQQRRLADYSVRELAAQRAVMPQSSVLSFAYRVEDVVRMGRAMRDLPPEEDQASIGEAMRCVEILPLRDRDATTLSGGEQARTTFARVQVQQTPLLILDEPTAALDLRHQEIIMAQARRHATQGGCVVVVMHDLNLAAAHADQLVLLDQGKVVAVGPPWDVLEADRLEQIYQQRVCVFPHPRRNCPVVVSSPGDCLPPQDSSSPELQGTK